MKPKILDSVALLHPISAERLKLVEPGYLTGRSLPPGLVGTVVEVYSQDENYLVEFSDSEGCEYAMAVLNANELLVLHLELPKLTQDLITA
jgi:hypothetical protein